MVVRMRSTRSHTGNRRSHHKLEGLRFSKCTNCGEGHIRHRACLSCGMYRGRAVIDVVKKAVKKEKKVKAKAREASK